MSTLDYMPGTPAEYEQALRRAFVDGHADFICIYDRRARFQIECAAWAEGQGYVTSEFVELDEQSSEYRFRLTEKGRKWLGLQ